MGEKTQVRFRLLFVMIATGKVILFDKWKALRRGLRLQNSRVFCQRERRISDGPYSNERSGAHALRACQARALHTRGSRLRRFRPGLQKRPKTTFLQSNAASIPSPVCSSPAPGCSKAC